MNPQDYLVVLFHGIGGSGAQLRPLASYWGSTSRNARFAAPDAPFSHPYGRQWFSLDETLLRPDRIQFVREAFDSTVEEIVRREGYEDAHHRIAFVGLSQGAIVSLDAVATGRWQVGALVSFAGLLPPVSMPTAARKTPILLVHGQNDRTIPAAASATAAAQLRSAGFEVTLDIEAGVGHTISPTGAQKALAFVRQSLS